MEDQERYSKVTEDSPLLVDNKLYSIHQYTEIERQKNYRIGIQISEKKGPFNPSNPGHIKKLYDDTYRCIARIRQENPDYNCPLYIRLLDPFGGIDLYFQKALIGAIYSRGFYGMHRAYTYKWKIYATILFSLGIFAICLLGYLAITYFSQMAQTIGVGILGGIIALAVLCGYLIKEIRAMTIESAVGKFFSHFLRRFMKRDPILPEPILKFPPDSEYLE